MLLLKISFRRPAASCKEQYTVNEMSDVSLMKPVLYSESIGSNGQEVWYKKSSDTAVLAVDLVYNMTPVQLDLDHFYIHCCRKKFDCFICSTNRTYTYIVPALQV